MKDEKKEENVVLSRVEYDSLMKRLETLQEYYDNKKRVERKHSANYREKVKLAMKLYNNRDKK